MEGEYYHRGVDVCQEPSSEHACAVATTTSVLAMLTVVGCAVKIHRVLTARVLDRLMLGIFCLALLECIFFSLKWVYVTTPVLHFLGIYLQVNQFLLVCVFYGGLMLRVLHKPALIKRFVRDPAD